MRTARIIFAFGALAMLVGVAVTTWNVDRKIAIGSLLVALANPLFVLP